MTIRKRTAASMLCAAAVGAAVLAAASPSEAAAAPTATTTHVSAHPQVVGYPNCGEVETVIGSVVNIRASWGTSSPIIGHAYYGDTVVVKFRTSYTYSGYYWAYGDDIDRDNGGYIATAFLRDDGYSAGCTYLQ